MLPDAVLLNVRISRFRSFRVFALRSSSCFRFILRLRTFSLSLRHADYLAISHSAVRTSRGVM